MLGVRMFKGHPAVDVWSPLFYRLFALVYAASLLINWSLFPILIYESIQAWAWRLCVLVVTAVAFLADDLKLLNYMAKKGGLPSM